MRSIVFNQLADSMEIRGEIPWDHSETKFWRDADDSQLIWYVDQNYGSFSQRNYDIAIDVRKFGVNGAVDFIMKCIE